MNRFYSGFMRWVVPVIFAAIILVGCGGGGGSGDNSPGGGPSGGGGTGGGGGGGGNNGNPTPPAVVSHAPTGGATSVEASIVVTFDKAMDGASFNQVLTVVVNANCDDAECNAISINDSSCSDPACKHIPFPFTNGVCTIPGCETLSFNNGVCQDTECKTVRMDRAPDLQYGTPYVVALSTRVKDKQGNRIASPYKWSFKTAPFVQPPSFIKGIVVDGNGKDSGECTALAIDSQGVIHIVYYSEEDGLPKHAYCSAGCDDPSKWQSEFIDKEANKLRDRNGVLIQKLGRDINLAIEGNTLHVSYRDIPDPVALSPSPGDKLGILKYATGAANPDGSVGEANWSTVIVDDTPNGVTDTYIAVNAGSVHISYRKVGATSTPDALTYATCSTNCGSTPYWPTVEIDHGSEAGAPNHIVVTPSAIHVSYYLDRTLKYATCLNDCIKAENWTPVVIQGRGIDFVDSNGIFIRREDILDVGTENSIAINNGTLHVTYRDNTLGSLKYARCLSGRDCTKTENWEKQESKIMEIQNEDGSISEIPIKMQVDSAGGSTQIKVDGSAIHVSYRDDANKDLKYARCLSNCLTPSQWSIQTLDAPGEVGLDTYLEVRNGQVYISYRDASNKDLKFTHGTP